MKNCFKLLHAISEISNNMNSDRLNSLTSFGIHYLQGIGMMGYAETRIMKSLTTVNTVQIITILYITKWSPSKEYWKSLVLRD